MQTAPRKPQDPASLQRLHFSVLPWRDLPRAPGGAAPVILKNGKQGQHPSINDVENTFITHPISAILSGS